MMVAKRMNEAEEGLLYGQMKHEDGDKEMKRLSERIREDLRSVRAMLKSQVTPLSHIREGASREHVCS
jgi:hypothetical protein